MSSSEDDVKYMPPENLEMETSVNLESPLLQLKSKENYDAAYQNFKNWRETKLYLTNENSIMEYFQLLSEKYKPTTLWAQYSMLKSTIGINEKIDISNFKTVSAFLKFKSQGFQSKRSNIFKAEEICEFIARAPDEFYLATKVCLILGIAGACRSDELVKLKTTEVEEHGKLLLVKVAGTKFKKSRSFTITPEYSDVVKQYQRLRPKRTETDRFFLNYQRGKCTVQVIGKNKFSSMPKQIAAFLKLKNPDLYTGHAFRRTAATLQKEVGSNILDLLTTSTATTTTTTTTTTAANSEGRQSQRTNQMDDKFPSIKFQEVLIPYEDSDNDYNDDVDEDDDSNVVPLKQPKLEIDYELKQGNDPLEKMV
ncbi:uncharacterized protein LOC122512403 [Leptopilina heterotoma]|uniref:uncharacterized protein LOC122512403 n=1 Tax=Leptopilina heterotoma TaxID=63436 RepID=UPI001CA7DD7F|nr:uncharacterized protein LOC122512403 [Leptopilina heterotoma]